MSQDLLKKMLQGNTQVYITSTISHINAKEVITVRT